MNNKYLKKLSEIKDYIEQILAEDENPVKQEEVIHEEEVEVAPTKQEDEQVDPFCNSKQEEAKSTEIEEPNNVDSVWDSSIDMVTREVLNHLGGNK